LDGFFLLEHKQTEQDDRAKIKTEQNNSKRANQQTRNRNRHEKTLVGRTKADVNGLDMGISFVYLVGKKKRPSKRPTRKDANSEEETLKSFNTPPDVPTMKSENDADQPAHSPTTHQVKNHTADQPPSRHVGHAYRAIR
jgi:hypothetical protein